MRWRKLGRVHVADGRREWARTHACCPTPIALSDGRVRVLCAFLDSSKVGRVGYVDIDAADPTNVIAVSKRPVFDIGEAGAFDDSGVTPLSACRDDDGAIRLYYAGWQLGVRVRYFLFAGLAVSEDDGETFRRVSRAPILDRRDGELHMRTGVHVRRDEGGWRMWYAGGSEWVGSPGVDLKPRYALREIASDDGLRWPGGGRVCLEPQGADELGFGRPCVLARPGGGLRMWYSLRTLGRGYRIGYAEAPDSRSWERHDERGGIDISARGWDSEMVCLSAIHETAGGTYMFYNGNNYGETGFGVAVAEP